MLVLMPALGGRIQIEIVGFQKPFQVHILAIPTSAKEPINKKRMQQQTIMTSKHDMLRYGSIHFDRHHRYSSNCV